MLGHLHSLDCDQFESARENSEYESTSTVTDKDDSTETGVTTGMETDHKV